MKEEQAESEKKMKEEIGELFAFNHSEAVDVDGKNIFHHLFHWPDVFLVRLLYSQAVLPSWCVSSITL